MHKLLPLKTQLMDLYFAFFKRLFFFFNVMWPLDVETLRDVPKYTQQESCECPTSAAHERGKILLVLAKV